MYPKTEYGEYLATADEFQLPLELPKGFTYKYERFSCIDETEGWFECEMRVSIHSMEILLDWKTEFQSILRNDLKSRKGAQENGSSFG
jgi:hypothetical protein